MKSSASESKPFQSRNSRPSQAGRTAGPLQIERAVLNGFRRRTFILRIGDFVWFAETNFCVSR